MKFYIEPSGILPDIAIPDEVLYLLEEIFLDEEDEIKEWEWDDIMGTKTIRHTYNNITVHQHENFYRLCFPMVNVHVELLDRKHTLTISNKSEYYPMIDEGFKRIVKSLLSPERLLEDLTILLEEGFIKD